MKKQFVVILVILLIVLAITAGYIYNVRRLASLTKNNNKQYENYYEQEVLGTDLISIINKAIDNNEKNYVEKQSDTIYYIDNGANSVQIQVSFIETDKPVKMEDIAKSQSENFVKFFGSSTFKCTKIEYHKQTNFVKSLYFEQTKL